ncbi:MAG: cytochrome d ubiquinol oxidase subunit II [Deltaproteobacteria bacterium]|nr:cytochrome d ubiquinol oxidase subunit II [Deltaproteobacteria bacterium]
MTEAVIAFLAASLLFYVLFGGADFGAGILELFLDESTRREKQRLISKAMAPVWEANHVWLVLAVVIVFMGFPTVYTTITTALHIPVMALLIGIVGRGCAFTFRHYDAGPTDYSRVYSKVFMVSSLWSSFFIGIIAGACSLGRIENDASTFYAAYIVPWANPFCFFMGLFCCALFAMLAAVYLIGEAKDPDTKSVFRLYALRANIALIITGPLLFMSAELDNLPLVTLFFGNSWCLFCFTAATILLVPLWISLRRSGSPLISRILAASIVTLVLFGWYALQYPLAIRFNESARTDGISFFTAAAPEATMRALLAALVAGSLLIFPALAYLFKVFKWETLNEVGD